MDMFTVLADASRRQILDELQRASRSVNELVASLELNQPAVSKHLKVLREAGFVSRRGAAQQRIYQLEPQPFEQLAAWLEPYRRLWIHHLDALERHLDRTGGVAPPRTTTRTTKGERHAAHTSQAKRARTGRRRARRRTLGARVHA